MGGFFHARISLRTSVLSVVKKKTGKSGRDETMHQRADGFTTEDTEVHRGQQAEIMRAKRGLKT